jgi:hypothetical protein
MLPLANPTKCRFRNGGILGVRRFTQKHHKTPKTPEKHPETPQKRIEPYTNI